MKTRTFLVEILWLIVEMYLCPQSGAHEKTVKNSPPIGHQTTNLDSSLERWYCPNVVRPPPRCP
jgi:hypothetical protein